MSYRLTSALPRKGGFHTLLSNKFSLSKDRFQSKIPSDRPSSELSGDGPVPAFVPNNRRVHQFCLHLKEQQKSRNHFISTSFVQTGS